MTDNRYNKLNAVLEDIKTSTDKATAKKLALEKSNRVIQRVDAFAVNCKECDQHFIDLENHLQQLRDELDQLDNSDFKQHRKKIEMISSHLHKEHKLVPDSYYLTAFMPIGISLGAAYGLMALDNIGLGMAMGISVGVAIGAGLDADAKKKGRVL